jgi:hypothetical protein
MANRNKKILKIIAFIIVLVAFFQLLWPKIFNPSSIAKLNPYPSEEYLQILGIFSPNGLSIITVIVGLVLIAWVAFIEL